MEKENFRRRSRYILVFGVLAAAFCVVTVLNINTGNVHISIAEICKILFEEAEKEQRQTLYGRYDFREY